ncbi:hypothetical protein AMS62_10310 [Bacillus sp. FJAT-18019]|nr:hypothetical protein AMS62_10310 [Bacillus sp. FJAT-18019]
MKKKWITVGAALLVLGVVQIAHAAEGINLVIHGKTVNTTEQVKIINGITFVPLRVIAENLNQQVIWDSETKTLTIEEKKKERPIERIVLQRGNDIFVTSDPGNINVKNEANQAFLFHLTTLYNEVYRGLLSTDLEADTTIKMADQIPVLKNSETTKEKSSETSSFFVRLVQPAYIPQPGENAPAAKDLLFYIDDMSPSDLQIGVQDPKNIREWKTYKVKGYGDWFKKECDIYLRASKGL